MTVYARPGAEGSLMSFQSRYDNYIGGEWVAPAQGRYFENPTPVTGQTFCEVARSDEADIERALDAAHAAAPAWGKTSRRRAGGDPQQDRRPHRGEPRIHRRRRILGQRQAGARDPQRRHPVGGGPLPVLRRSDPRAGRLAVADRRRHRRLPLPRTARRGRPDHPVELPDPDGHLEAGAGPGRGQCRGAQAGRADPGLDPLPDVADRRPAPGRGAQRGQRVRRRGGQAAGVEQPHRQDRVHRRDHHRPADHAVRQPEPDPGDAGTGRQEPQHLLQRRPGRP